MILYSTFNHFTTLENARKRPNEYHYASSEYGAEHLLIGRKWDFLMLKIVRTAAVVVSVHQPYREDYRLPYNQDKITGLQRAESAFTLQRVDAS